MAILDSKVNPEEVELRISEVRGRMAVARKKLVEMYRWEKKHPERRLTFETELRFAGVEDRLKMWGRRLHRLRQVRKGEMVLCVREG